MKYLVITLLVICCNVCYGEETAVKNHTADSVLKNTTNIIPAPTADPIIINNTTEIIPEVSTVDPPSNKSTTTSSPIPPTSTTTASTTTTSNTTTVTTSTVKPTTATTKTTPLTSTTPKPTTIKPNVTTVTSSPLPVTTPVPTPNNRKFDGPSFVGGIVLACGLMAIGLVAFKFYKARTELNYHTL